MHKIKEWWKGRYSDTDTLDPITIKNSRQQDITLDELKDVIKMIGNNKASGPDEIPGELIKYGGDVVARLLYPLMKNIWQQNHVPDEMKEPI